VLKVDFEAKGLGGAWKELDASTGGSPLKKLMPVRDVVLRGASLSQDVLKTTVLPVVVGELPLKKMDLDVEMKEIVPMPKIKDSPIGSDSKGKEDVLTKVDPTTS
jgi:hypothetical protein